MSAARLTLGAEAEGLEVVPVAEAEDRKRAEALRRRVPAYALIRAMVTQDQEAAVLVVDQARRRPGPWTSWRSTWPRSRRRRSWPPRGTTWSGCWPRWTTGSSLAANGVPSAQRARDAAA